MALSVKYFLQAVSGTNKGEEYDSIIWVKLEKLGTGRKKTKCELVD